MKLLDLLLEYSEKTITTTIDRWKEANPTLDDKIARQIILRFEQIKQGLSSKLNQVALSDELKDNQNYLNIDKYTLDDMVKLLRSIPEKDDKIKKEAIKKFMDEEAIDKGIASHYVIRFMNARKDLKYAIENGTEDGNFSKEEVAKFIPRRVSMQQQELDPRAWSFQNLEHMLDALFPYQGKVGEGDEENTATTDADKIYEQNGLEVYKGDAQHKCVAYNPTKDGRKKYGWCIAQPGNSNYDYYRFQQGTNRMFYIVFDREQPEDNKWHAFVIHVGENGNYWATSAKNDGDNRSDTWEGLSKYIDSKTWNKLKGLEKLFKYVPPSKAEIQSAALRGKKLSAQDFRELDYNTKETYIQSNAGSLSREILQSLDKELKNLAINYGQKFPYVDLKENEGLAKRYAVFRFRHTNYQNDPIPLPYIQYLDEPAKEKYMQAYDDKLNFDYVQKYFGNQTLEKYIENKTKKLDIVTSDYIQYIKDPKVRKIYEVYNKLISNWEFGSDFGVSEEELENMSDMPEQSISPSQLNASQFFKLFNEVERRIIIELAKKYKGEEYAALVYALPYIIKNGNEYFFLLPKDNEYHEWYLFNLAGNQIESYGDDLELDGESFAGGYPKYDDYNKIYDWNDLSGGILNEIKINPPKRYTNQDYIDLFSKIYEENWEADINDILIKYIPDNIWDNQDIGQIEFFEYVPPKYQSKLMKELEDYYNQEIENNLNEAKFRQQEYIKRQLMNRAGLL